MAKRSSGDIYSKIKHHIINIVALILLVIAVAELILMKLPRGVPLTVPATQPPCAVTTRKPPVRKKKTRHKQRTNKHANVSKLIM